MFHNEYATVISSCDVAALKRSGSRVRLVFLCVPVYLVTASELLPTTVLTMRGPDSVADSVVPGQSETWRCTDFRPNCSPSQQGRYVTPKTSRCHSARSPSEVSDRTVFCWTPPQYANASTASEDAVLRGHLSTLLSRSSADVYYVR